MRLAALLLAVLALLLLTIRSQPYPDRVTASLLGEDCAAPCFMGIRPGTTSMSQAYFLLAAHPWVANSPDEFPSLIRESSHIGAGIPRTVVDWRWSAAHPDWIDSRVPGAIMMENVDVLAITVGTNFTLGEMLLAFGPPDALYWNIPTRQNSPQVDYTAWYAAEGVEVRFVGSCPLRWPYHQPVSLHFRSVAPPLTSAMSEAHPC